MYKDGEISGYMRFRAEGPSAEYLAPFAGAMGYMHIILVYIYMYVYIYVC